MIRFLSLQTPAEEPEFKNPLLDFLCRLILVGAFLWSLHVFWVCRRAGKLIRQCQIENAQNKAYAIHE